MWWAPTDTYLAHHGIKGQKWGIRRYQNPDGTYTAAGKARYFGDEPKFYKGTGIPRIKNEQEYKKLLSERKELQKLLDETKNEIFDQFEKDQASRSAIKKGVDWLRNRNKATTAYGELDKKHMTVEQYNTLMEKWWDTVGYDKMERFHDIDAQIYEHKRHLKKTNQHG